MLPKRIYIKTPYKWSHPWFMKLYFERESKIFEVCMFYFQSPLFPLKDVNCMDSFLIINVKLTHLQNDLCEGQLTEEELEAIKYFWSGKNPRSWWHASRDISNLFYVLKDTLLACSNYSYINSQLLNKEVWFHYYWNRRDNIQ